MTSPAHEKLQVLVVDDDEMNRRMMQLILTREDHDVKLASNGFEACEIAKVQHFDIILMDLQMPEIDGIETSRRIRALGTGSNQAYIVALTASYLPEKGQELFDAGIDNYIAKPFDVEHLRQMLRHGLDSRRVSPPTVVENFESNMNNKWKSFNPTVGVKQVGGDETMFRELLSDFVDELPQKIDHMDKYLAERDMEDLSRGAHNLKGVSSNLGLLQLSQYAGSLENRASEGYTESVTLDLEVLKTKADEFIRDASDFLASAKNK